MSIIVKLLQAIKMTRHIPNDIKRQVRQRCGFGCVICGIPFYHYDHILEWSKVQEHDPDNIILLCAKHHDEKTRGALPETKVKLAQEAPYNLKRETSASHELHYDGNLCKVFFGGNEFSLQISENDNNKIHCFYPLLIDGQPILLFYIDDNRLFMNLVLYDDCNKIAVLIEDNQIIFSTNFWDIEYKSNKLTIRNNNKDIFIELIFDVPNKIVIKRGKILKNGIYIHIENNIVTCLNNLGNLKNNNISQSMYGYSFGDNGSLVNSKSYFGEINCEKAMFQMKSIPRYFFDVKKRLSENNKFLKRIQKIKD